MSVAALQRPARSAKYSVTVSAVAGSDASPCASHYVTKSPVGTISSQCDGRFGLFDKSARRVRRRRQGDLSRLTCGTYCHWSLSILELPELRYLSLIASQNKSNRQSLMCQ
jgi:hypothetical protein